MSPEQASELVAKIADVKEYADVIDSVLHLAVTSEGRVPDADIGRILRARLHDIAELIEERAAEDAKADRGDMDRKREQEDRS